MFQLFKDIFALTSVRNISQAENWQDDIADCLRDLVRVDRKNNRYVVSYKGDIPYFIYIIQPVDDRYYVYVKDYLNDHTASMLRCAVGGEIPLDKYYLMATPGGLIDIEGVTYHGVAFDVTGEVTDETLLGLFKESGQSIIDQRKDLPPEHLPTIFITGDIRENHIQEMLEMGFVAGSLMYKF